MSLVATIVVPVFNEIDCLEACVSHLRAYRNKGFEILLVDGGSSDATVDKIRYYRDSEQIDGFITAQRGRAIQMNAGAALANSPWVLFLHVDTQLPSNVDDVIEVLGHMRASNKYWGFFSVKLSGESVWFRIIERAMNLRSSLTRIATGDQVLLVDRGCFKTMEGFAAIPLMEDVEFCRRAKKQFTSYLIPFSVVTSSRRWENYGIFRTMLLMWSLRLQYWVGVPVEKLARQYRK